MDRRHLACSLLIVALGAAEARAAADPLPKIRIGYLGSRFDPPDADAQKAFDAAVTHGLVAANVAYIQLAPADIPLMAGRPCATTECLAQLTSKVGLDYVVLADVQPRTEQGASSYKVDLQVIRPAPLASPLTSHFSCDACIPEALGEKADIASSKLMADLIITADLNRSSEKATAQPPPGADLRAPAPAPAARSEWPLWTLVGGGVGIAVGSVLAFGLGNHSECDGASASVCGTTKDYRPAGWTIGGLGLAAAVVGGAFLLSERF